MSCFSGEYPYIDTHCAYCKSSHHTVKDFQILAPPRSLRWVQGFWLCAECQTLVPWWPITRGNSPPSTAFRRLIEAMHLHSGTLSLFLTLRSPQTLSSAEVIPWSILHRTTLCYFVSFPSHSHTRLNFASLTTQPLATSDFKCPRFVMTPPVPILPSHWLI